MSETMPDPVLLAEVNPDPEYWRGKLDQYAATLYQIRADLVRAGVHDEPVDVTELVRVLIRQRDQEREVLERVQAMLDRVGVPRRVVGLDPLTLESLGDEPSHIRELGTHERELTTLERLDMLLRERRRVALSVGGACRELMHALEDPRSGVSEQRLATEDELAKATAPIGMLRHMVSEACRKLQQEREARLEHRV